MVRITLVNSKKRSVPASESKSGKYISRREDERSNFMSISLELLLHLTEVAAIEQGASGNSGSQGQLPRESGI